MGTDPYRERFPIPDAKPAMTPLEKMAQERRNALPAKYIRWEQLEPADQGNEILAMRAAVEALLNDIPEDAINAGAKIVRSQVNAFDCFRTMLRALLGEKT